jgi:hypothetical protein
VILPPAEWLAAATGVPAEKCAAVFAGGIDVGRDLLSRADVHEVVAETPAVDSRLSAKYAWLVPTVKAHAKEAQLGVLAAANKPASKAASVAVPLKVCEEAKARYLAYQGRALAAHDQAPNLPLLVAECRRHHLGTPA